MLNSGCFKKGQIPWNKGIKGSTGAYGKTRFKKGHKPWHIRPVKSERIDRDGYTYVKTKSEKWKLKHRLIYQKHHGEISPKDCVFFLDGNKQNFDINNLILATRKQSAFLAHHKVWAKPVEVRRTYFILAKIYENLHKMPH